MADKYLSDMDKFYMKREVVERSYFTLADFLDDFNQHKLKDGFRMDEGTFQQLIGAMQADPALAKKINDGAVVLLMAAADKQEIESLLVMAETFLDG